MILSPVFWFSESFKVSHILWEALVPDLLRSASYQRSLPKQENWQSGNHEIIWNPPRHPRNLCGNNQITIRFLDQWCFLAAFSEDLHWIGCQLVGLLRLLKASTGDIFATWELMIGRSRLFPFGSRHSFRCDVFCQFRGRAAPTMFQVGFYGSEESFRDSKESQEFEGCHWLCGFFWFDTMNVLYIYK